ncbi:hypothetical protein ABTK14_21090, partial [Acinetobacter baumannii]
MITAASSSVFIPVLLYPAFQAVTFRWRMNGPRIGGASIASEFRIGTAYRIYVLAALAMSALGMAASMIVILLLGGMFVAFMTGAH